MKKMDVVFILDKSGSMHSLVEDALGGYNALIDKTKKLDADIKVTTVLFNTRMDRLYNRIPINEIPLMTKEDYIASGGTALLDAVGSSIDSIDECLEEEDDHKVVFYITTDGMENSSMEYNYKMIQKMIRQHEKLGFEFNFLASGIDCTEVGAMMGIKEQRCMAVPTGRKGQKVLYDAVYCSLENHVDK